MKPAVSDVCISALQIT